jgi:hypothetical protein
VLHGVLARSDAEVSATETIRARYDEAASLATLVPIHQTLVQAADRDRYAAVLQTAGLDEQTVARIVDSLAYGALVTLLRAGEHAGHPIAKVLTHAAGTAIEPRGDGTADGTDLAAALHDRVTRWLEETGPASDEPALVAGLVPAARHVTDPELARTLSDIEDLITGRTHALVSDLLRRPPTWAAPLGPPPRDRAARRSWLDAMAVVAGYRDLHQIHDEQPLGDAVDRQPDGDDRRRATTAAATAARLARSHPAATTRAAHQSGVTRSLQR